MHDRQVVQNVELSPVVPAYVDTYAVIGENRPRVTDRISTIKNRLESKGTEEPSDHRRLFGLIFVGTEIVSVSAKRGCGNSVHAF